jgi:hypothetical protein
MELNQVDHYESILVSRSGKVGLQVEANVSWRYHFRYGPKKAYLDGVYANDEEYFADLAKAYQVELKILYDAGLRNVREPCYSAFHIIIR